MPKKLSKDEAQEEPTLWEELSEEPFKQEALPPAAEPEPKPAKVYYTKELWKGKVDVYMCTQCAHCLNVEDDMIMHVIGHYPVTERNQLLDELVKAKKNKEK